MRSARSKDTHRAGPPVSQVLGTPKRTSVRWPGRVFCKSKIWKGEKAAGGSHDNGGQGGWCPQDKRLVELLQIYFGREDGVY